MGFWNFFNNKKNNVFKNDYSVLKTDMHAHLLPGIDDGAKDLQHSLTLIESLQQLGYSKLFATPHVMSGQYNNTPEIIFCLKDKVNEAISNAGLNIFFDVSAEYYFEDNFFEIIRKKQYIPIAGKYVLFELPLSIEPLNWREAVFQLQLQGIIPVLAHPERYLYFYHKKEVFHEIYEKGVILQLNMLSLTGYYGKPVKNLALYLLKNGLVKLAGTDLHHENHARLLKDALQNKNVQNLINSPGLINCQL